MNKDNRYSEEFSDTVSQFPEFNTILFYSLIGIIGITILILSIIKSPEIIMGEAKITAKKPPIEIIAHNSGRIILKEFIAHKVLKKDAFLAVIENSADDKDVMELKKKLKTFKNRIFDLKQADITFAVDYKLGEIEDYYLELVNSLYLLEKAKIPNEFDKKKSVLNHQTGKYLEMIDQRKSIKKIKHQDILLLKNRVEEDSILFAKGLIVKSEYEQDQRNYLREKENLKNYEARDIENRLNINDNLQNIDLLSFQRKVNISDLQIKALSSYQQLIQSINFWESKYVLKVPVDGKVDMMQFLTSYQTIKMGEPVFSILPGDLFHDFGKKFRTVKFTTILGFHLRF
ncbi:hypothetical protein [Flavobacterium olei]|uniref:hypothetical protein n=1 Tax=Flavobacterium olei TaxID=1886782 RepID=UPI00321A3380